MLVAALPQVVAKAAEPLSAIDELTRHLDGRGKPLSRQVTDNGTQGMELRCSTTGVDLAELLKGLARSRGSDSAAPDPAPGDGKIESA